MVLEALLIAELMPIYLHGLVLRSVMFSGASPRPRGSASRSFNSILIFCEAELTVLLLFWKEEWYTVNRTSGPGQICFKENLHLHIVNSGRSKLPGVNHWIDVISLFRSVKHKKMLVCFASGHNKNKRLVRVASSVDWYSSFV